ncbi:PREDICTED: heat shock transcription factor, X-linked-like [Colobus angolensis palliatus]|uniref:heat shock transcription factor, X-linked-like n=1 Tax=Colobus angolensis palliatus TaxID=336983 RepID=UPI0005F513C8|nr:PREDICTED: heat shock transcription factor, X-linked-like [Colobus angolensis palliatus]
MEDKPSLSVALCEERNSRGQGHGLDRLPFPPQLHSETYLHPADPSPAWDDPVSTGSPNFRLLTEEVAFQALAEEALFRRPRPDGDIPPQGEDNLLSLPFPQKLWRLVNSNRFSSIWWDEGGACIVINQKLFEKEILERDVAHKVFATDSIKSFFRQLNLYGFRKRRQRSFRTLTHNSARTRFSPYCRPREGPGLEARCDVTDARTGGQREGTRLLLRGGLIPVEGSGPRLCEEAREVRTLFSEGVWTKQGPPFFDRHSGPRIGQQSRLLPKGSRFLFQEFQEAGRPWSETVSSGHRAEEAKAASAVKVLRGQADQEDRSPKRPQSSTEEDL